MFTLSNLVKLLTPTANTLFGSHLNSRPARAPAAALLRTMAQLQQAVVRSLPGEPNLTITLTLGGRQRNLDRPKAELLEKPLARLQKAAAPAPGKKQKRGAAEAAAAAPAAESSAPLVALHEGPTAEHPLLDAAATTNEAAWLPGRLLRVGDALFAVHLNPPAADRVHVHGTPFVGIPLVPLAQLHFADEDACEWEWQRREPGPSAAAWEPVEGGRRRRYVPAPADAGRVLRVTCTPARRAPGGGVLRGEPAAAECGPVAAAPAPGAGAGRHAHTAAFLSAPDLRVVTYNILADQYAATDTARDVLFAHCPPECLAPEYRRPLVLGELLGYRADVAALQEVDEKMFSLCLEPALGEAGYAGAFANKAGKVREGGAVFWRRERFALAARREVALKSLFPAEEGGAAKYGAAFEPMLRTSPALRAALQRVATVAQMVLLVPPGAAASGTADGTAADADDPALRPLCVVNTHLFFHHAAPHIRTMHVWAILQEAAAFIEASMADEGVAAACGGRRPALLFCGDLNSDLNDGIPGAIELLSTGRVPADHWDWQFGVAFRWDKDEEDGGDGGAGAGEGGELSKMVHTEVEAAAPAPPRAGASGPVPGVPLASPFDLVAADGLASAFTNHVRGYQGLLDYVWLEAGALEVRRLVPLPSEEELGGYLPSRRFPSDHLAVVCELRVKRTHTGRLAAASPEGGGGGDSGGGGEGEAECGGGSVSRGGGGGEDGGDAAGGGAVLPAAMHNVGVAARLLRRGGVIAAPTDTLYGLAACAADGAAIARLYAAKGRPGSKPLAVCVADHADVARYVHVDHLPPGLLEGLLPGAVTLLLARRADAPLSPALNPGVAALGVRIPAAAFLRAAARQHRGALALTSANPSGAPSSVAAGEFRALWPRCDAVFDGGALGAGREGSTVVDLSVAGRFRVARRGAELEATLRALRETYGLTELQEGEGEAR